DYSLGFRDDQVEWLRQDLSYVPKDKMVIFCVHIPMRASNNQNVQAVLELLKPFAEVHIMSGHTHYAENNTYDSHYEHVHGAACGAWWHSTINTDGTPNGYAIYKVKGATIDNWVYKATGFDPDFQIRLYRGSDIFMEGYTPSYQFYYKGDDQIVANIWNADKDWKIEVYENGTKTGEMKPYESNATKRDAWASGYHCGVQGRAPGNYDRTNTSHLYYYTLQSSTASVEVRATDKFGQTYSQSKFTTGLAEDFPVGE
ncbi:calcineurin-like phosphoesterase C-terminal domain-containing protein, partial [Alistipes putredinis]